MTPLFDPAEFDILPGVTHVCAGGETAVLHRHADALAQYLADKSKGMAGRLEQEHSLEAARAGIAALWGVTSEDIGFVGNVAEGVAMIAESLDWQPGDSICVDVDEYPSVVGPFGLHRHPGIRLIQATGSEPDRLAACVDASTRLIAVSYVSYLTGERIDLAPLRAVADRIGALLLVDFTQASGYLPIDASLADFAFAACYKWMLGITGVAVAYWNRVRQPHWTPASAGWHSFAPGGRGYEPMPSLRADAMRFTRGNPAHASIYVLNSALSFLARFEPREIQRHVQTLTTTLIAELRQQQIPLMTPPDPSRHGASVCIASSRAQAIVDALAMKNILTWNGHGRIRVSFHGYNDLGDVQRVAAALLVELRAGI